MDGSLNFDGKKYISAKLAAKEFDYTSDYISQLCRSKKVDARMVGRSWYVLEKDLIDHKNIINNLPVTTGLKKSKSLESADGGSEVKKERTIRLVKTKNQEYFSPISNGSRIADLGSKDILYLNDEKPLFPNTAKKISLNSLRYTATESISRSLKKSLKKPFIEKFAISAAIIFGLFIIPIAGYKIREVPNAHLLNRAGEEVGFLFDPYITAPTVGQENSQIASIAPSFSNGWQSVSGWVKDLAYKIVKPWFEEEPVLVDEEKENKTNQTITIANQTTSAQILPQAKTVFVTGADKEYVDLKIAELKNYFLINPLAPNVNRYYVTRQNDAIVESVNNSSSSSSSSSGVSSLSELSDITLTSTAYGDVLMYNGTDWINTATSSLGIIGSASSYPDFLGQIGDVSTTTLQNGYVLKWNSSSSEWESVATSTLGLGGSSGTVSSVDMSVPTGFTISGNPITSAGTLVLGLDSGYFVPTTTRASTWDTAYSWGNHAAAGYLTSAITAIGPLNQTSDGPTTTFATSTTGTDFTITGSGDTITFNIPTASGSNRGLLSSSDWTTFNNKASFSWPFTANTGYVSTSTTLGLLNGFFSTASSTISSSLFLPSLSQGFAYVGSNGLLNTAASSSLFGFTPISNSLTKGYTLVGDDTGTAQATSTIFISSTGNVGIGTTNPSVSALTLRGSGAQLTTIESATSKSYHFEVNSSRYRFVETSVGYPIVIDPTYDYVSISDPNAPANQKYNFIVSAGNLGVGTTTPFALLQLSSTTASATFKPQLALSDYSAGTNKKHWTISSQGGNFYIASATDAYATTSISALEISSNGFGTTTVRGFNISGQATSTSNVGFNITNGCYAVNGVCVGGGTSGLTFTWPFTVNTGYVSTSTTLGLLNGFFSTASSTISGALNLPSVSLNSLLSTDASGVVTATSTPTFGNFNATSTNATSTIAGGLAIEGSGFVYDFSSGNVGIGTAAPIKSLHVNGSVLSSGANTGSLMVRDEGTTANRQAFEIESDNGSLNFNHVADNLSGDLNPDLLSINYTGRIGVGDSAPDAMFEISQSGITTYNAFMVSSNDSTDGDRMIINQTGLVGIGTTTPQHQLTVSSSTAPQLSLSAGGGLPQWTMRNAGGNLYFATTTIDGTATSSLAAFSINGTSGTTTMWAFDAIATGSNATSTIEGNLNIKGVLKVGNSSVYISESGIHNTGASAFDLSGASGQNVTIGGGSLSVSSTGFGTTTVSGLNISGQATSTSNVGINLSGGCYAIDGTCIGGISTTGDWTGTIDGNNFAGGAIGTGELIYGGSAGSFSELAAGTNGYILAMSGGIPAWVATTSMPIGGDVTGTLSAAVVGDDSHNHTASTISGLGVSDFSSANISQWTNDAGFTSYSWPFTAQSWGVSTTTTLGMLNGFLSTASSTIVGNATTTGTLGAGRIYMNGDYITDFTGTGLTLSSGALTLNATGDWTGTIDGNNFAGGAIGTGELIYGGSAGSFSELAAGTDGYILAMSGGLPAWVATTSMPIGGDVSGSLSATVVGDDSHNHTASSISGLGVSDFSSANISQWTNDAGFTSYSWPFTVNTGYVSTSTTLGLLNGFFSTASSTISGALNLPSVSLNSLLSTDASGVVTATSTPTFGNFNATSTIATSTISTGGLTIGSSQFVVQQNSGRVGIGVTNPTAALNALGTWNATGNIVEFMENGALAKDRGAQIGLGGIYTGTSVTSFGLIKGAKEVADDNDFAGYLSMLTRPSGGSFTERMRITSSGKIGIGTTTPFALLQLSSTTASATFKPQLALSDYSAGTDKKHWTISSQGGNFYIASATDAYATTSISALEISSNGFGTTTVRGLNISGQATSTSNVGFNITNGCYAVNGVCVGGGSGASTYLALTDTPSSFTASAIPYTNSGATALLHDSKFVYNGNLGVGTSSPYAKLSIHANNGETNQTLFSVASSTASATTTFFTILNGGNVGVGLSTTTALFAIQGTAGTNDLFRISSSTGAALLSVNNFGAITQKLSSTTAVDIQNGSGTSVFAIDTATTTGAGIDITAASGQTANLFNIFQSNGTTNYLAVGPSGNFGVGTGTPSHLFTIASSTAAQEPIFDIYYNPSGATSTIGFFVSTTTGSAAGVGLGLPSALANYIIVGNGKVQAGMAIVNGGLCIDNDGWCTASTTGRISSITSTTGGTDLAEIYNSNDKLEAGDVVAVTSPVNFVKIADLSNDENKTLGVVATDPGLILGLKPGEEQGNGQYPIALAGRVPVKVSTENGNIETGDYLTLSSTPGVAMKAIEAGNVIGKALEPYSSEEEGKIIMFVTNTYYAGEAVIAINNIFYEASTTDVTASSTGDTASSTGDIATSSGLSSESGIGAAILKFLEGMGLKIMNGIAYVKNIFAEKLTVGTPENPSGITLYDKQTGEPYCVQIENGAMVSTAGECNVISEPEPELEAEEPAANENGGETNTEVQETDPEIGENDSSESGNTNESGLTESVSGAEPTEPAESSESTETSESANEPSADTGSGDASSSSSESSSQPSSDSGSPSSDSTSGSTDESSS